MNISDVVTFYRRLVKSTLRPLRRRHREAQNIIFNVDSSSPRRLGRRTAHPGRPPTVNPNARKPRWPSEIAAKIDSLGSTRSSATRRRRRRDAREHQSAEPKRLDIETVVQVSGNANQKGHHARLGLLLRHATQVA